MKNETKSHLIFFFNRFSPFKVSFCSLIMGITPKIRMVCFVLTHSVILNLLCVWVLKPADENISTFSRFDANLPLCFDSFPL